MDLYKIVRMYRDNPHFNRTVLSGITLQHAQRHCRDKETSASTATSKEARARTAARGPWFDGYELVKPKRKTKDEYQLLIDYGYGDGWEHETSEDTRAEILKRVKEYRENCPEYPVKWRARRVPITS